jgi:hypothetical protein
MHVRGMARRKHALSHIHHAVAQPRVGSVLWAVLRVHRVVAVGVRAHNKGQVHVRSHGWIGSRDCLCIVHAVEAVGVG